MRDNKEQLKVVILDDHPMVIEGLKNIINSDDRLRLESWFTTAVGFMDFIAFNSVDIVLLDITLPDGSGLQLCREIRLAKPETIILAISNLNEPSIIRQMLQNGANGYLLKTADPKDILFCIENALQGGTVLSKEVETIFDLKELNEPFEMPELTKREKQILSLLAEGKKSGQIAEELFISPLTVKTHRATVLQKFETSNIVTAINKARALGIIN